MRKIFKSLMIGFLSIMALAILGCGKKSIDLNKYVIIEEQGYDSIGSVSFSFDYDAFKKDCGGKSIDNAIIDKCISLNTKKIEGIKNGDEVTVKWKCDEKVAEDLLDVKLKYSNINYTVHSLKEIKEFNPFDYIKLEYFGTSPNGSANLVIDYSRPEMNSLYINLDKNDKLKNKDSIKVSVMVNGEVQDFINEFGEIIRKNQEIYIVNGLEEYVTDIKDIPQDAYKLMDNQLQSAFNAQVANWTSEEKATISLIGNYMVTLKNGMSERPNNYVYFIYKVNYSNQAVQDYTYYWYGYYEDLRIGTDGKLKLALEEYTVARASNLIGRPSGEYLIPNKGNYVAGYKDIDSFFKAHIQTKAEKYEYKKDLKE